MAAVLFGLAWRVFAWKVRQVHTQAGTSLGLRLGHFCRAIIRYHTREFSILAALLSQQLSYDNISLFHRREIPPLLVHKGSLHMYVSLILSALLFGGVGSENGHNSLLLFYYR